MYIDQLNGGNKDCAQDNNFLSSKTWWLVFSILIYELQQMLTLFIVGVTQKLALDPVI